MRIALFTDTYAPQVNGVARTLARLVAHLRARGDAVALVSPRVPGAVPADVDLHIDPPGLPLPFYPELRVSLPVTAAAAKRLGAFDPDVVHVATEFTLGWSGIGFAEAHGVPVVSSFHTDFPAYLAGYGFGGLERRAWDWLRSFHERATCTMCPSTATLEQLLANGFHHRLSVWSRGVDAAHFTPDRRSEEARRRLAPGAERILLYVGRLAPEKRIDVALDAFARIREAAPAPTTLVVVGDGPSGAGLRARGVPGVRFAGWLHGDALADAYAAADLFLFPSDTETFGNVVLEAMASGLPVVCADRGGVTDSVVPGRTGVRARAGDPVAFADAALGLLHDDVHRRTLAEGARLHASGASWPHILDGVRMRYLEAAADRRTVRAA